MGYNPVPIPEGPRPAVFAADVAQSPLIRYAGVLVVLERKLDGKK
jgi:hypothetical protein